MFNAIIVAELSPEIHSSIGTYAYTADLCALGSARPPEVYTILPELEGMQSPLTDRRQQWQECLSAHPDKRFVDYILDGIKGGLPGWLRLCEPTAFYKSQYAISRSAPESDRKLYHG